jgi:hypothetical protein
MGYPGGPYPAPRPRRRRWPIVLLVVAAVLAVCCGGGGYAVYRLVDRETAPVRAAANAFVDDLQAGRTDAAYDRLCTPVRQRLTRAAFASYVQGRPKITKHSTVGFSSDSTAGRQSGSVTMNLTYANGGTQRHVFVLVRENGVFRVCGDPY